MATGTTPPCAGGWRGMDARGLAPESSPRPALLQGGLRRVGIPVLECSTSCHQPVPASLSLGLPPAHGDRAVIECHRWHSSYRGGLPPGCVGGSVVEGPTGCSPPLAQPWACRPKLEGAHGPLHVGAGGSVPVPAASLDGARRTSCERRRPAGVRCRTVPGWLVCRSRPRGSPRAPSSVPLTAWP